MALKFYNVKSGCVCFGRLLLPLSELTPRCLIPFAKAAAPTGLTLFLASPPVLEDAPSLLPDPLVRMELVEALAPPWVMGPTEEAAVGSDPQKFFTI